MTTWLTQTIRHGRDHQRRLMRRLGRRQATVGVNGYRMTLDLRDPIISDWLFVRRTWEPYESRLLSRVLRPGATFLDIGAHIGYYSLLAAGRVGARGQVFSFEPAPENYQRLVRNVRQNRLERVVHPEHCAVADRPGEVTLYLSAANNGDHRVFAPSADDDALFNAGQPRAQVKVPAVSIDAYLEQRHVSHVDVIKLDVQGSELHALRGMAATLRHNPDLVLFMEYWEHGLLAAGTRPLDLLQFLTAEAGLALVMLVTPAEQVVPITLEELLAHPFDPGVQVDLIGARSAAALQAALAA